MTITNEVVKNGNSEIQSRSLAEVGIIIQHFVSKKQKPLKYMVSVLKTSRTVISSYGECTTSRGATPSR